MQDTITAAIESALEKLGIEPVDFTIEHPADITHGDYATNVALVAAKASGSNPRALATEVVNQLEGQLDAVESLAIAGPGFINFHLKRTYFSDVLETILTADSQWGRNESWTGKQVVVEYTDPNPFKEFHIGHLFTNTVGESLARLFMMHGADTKRVNYQGDVGLHVACAIYGMQELGLTGVNELSSEALGKAYTLGATANKDDEAAKEKIRAINNLIYERSDEVINALYDSGRATSLAYFETIYQLVGTAFDHYFFESEAAPRGKELVLAHPETFVESDGARVFKGDEFGLHTRVFLNSDGLPTYEAKELALAKMKAETIGEYDLSVISTSNEITEYFKVLKKAMSFVYPELAEKTEHIGHGTVRLTSGKMSSRTGDVIPALDFIGDIAAAAKDKIAQNNAELAKQPGLAEAIAIGAIKYATLKGSILQDSVFDKEKALSFEGDSGPYLQYTHARIHSVLKKASEAGVEASTTAAPETAYPIERLLYQFPEVVAAALEDRAPHKVTTYLTDLAGAFNTFYGQERIADAGDVHAPYKAAVARAVALTLKNGLWVLGIEAPDAM